MKKLLLSVLVFIVGSSCPLVALTGEGPSIGQKRNFWFTEHLKYGRLDAAMNVTYEMESSEARSWAREQLVHVYFTLGKYEEGKKIARLIEDTEIQQRLLQSQVQN